MPIRNMLSQNQDTYPTGAFCPIEGGYAENKLCFHDTHHGKCLFETERNGYDDSDFFMTIWDEETNSPRSIMFGTTRFWSYPSLNGSFSDATDEIKAKYQSWYEECEQERERAIRDSRFKYLKKIREKEAKIVSEYNVSPIVLIKLRKAFGSFMRVGGNYDTYGDIINLLTNRRIRSNFKVSMKSQVIEWMKSDSPKYDKPLSPKQLQYI